MQSAIAHALDEVARIDGETVDIDAVPRDDPTTFELIRSTRTLGMFQIESPGQRELVGKFGPQTFEDIVIDRKSTRLNSSHANISYAVFCLKKKKQKESMR